MDESQFVAALIGVRCDAAREAILAQALGEHATALEPFAQEVKSAWFDRYLNADLKRAFAVADGLYQLGNMAQHALVSALGLLARGDVERQSGHALTAMALHQRAGERFLGAGDRVGWARARGGWLIAASQAGKVTLANLAEMTAVRAIFADAGQSFRLAVLEQNIGLAYQNLGNLQEALAAFERGIALIDEQKQSNLAAMLIGNKANLLLWQGQVEQALALHRIAHALFQKSGNNVSAAVENMLLAGLENMRWHCRDALLLASEAITILQTSTQVIALSNAYIYRSEILSTLNRFEDAALDATRAVLLLHSYQFPIDLAYALRVQARAFVRCDKEQEALASIKEAELIVTKAGYQQRSIPMTIERITLLLYWGKVEEAQEAALELLRTPVAHNTENYRGLALLLAAESTLAKGKVRHAQTMAHAAMKLGHRMRSPELLYRSHLILARIACVNADWQKTCRHFDEAFDQLQQIVEMLVLDQKAQFLEDKDSIYMEAIASASMSGDAAKAFAYLEQSRGQHLPTYQGAASQQNSYLQELRKRHRYVSNSLLAMASNDFALGAAQRELKRLTNEVRDILESQTQQAMGTSASASVALATIPEALTVLAYALLESDLVIFVIHDGQITIEHVVDGARLIRKCERVLRLNIDTLTERLATTSPSQVSEELAQWERPLRLNLGRLWEVLIQPVLHLLPPDGAPIALIPHSSLHAIPLLALHDGQHCLAERWLVHVLPSSRAFSATKRPPAKASMQMLALGYSHDETLPQATTEAQHLAAIMGGTAWIGAEAQGERLLKEGKALSHLHIAAHGALRFDVPNASFVQLADGPFHPTDVIEMDLRECRLVTLSACETGLGRMSGGDEQIGLVRAFGFAGAEAVLATLWRVDDASTFAFMTCFYQQIAAGDDPALALQQAQRSFISGEAGTLRRHPYFWAGFQLTTNVWHASAAARSGETEVTQRVCTT